MSFPEEFGSSSQANYYEQLVRKMRAQADFMRTRDEAKIKIIKEISDTQIDLLTPKNFDNNDSANYVLQIEKNFESLCATLEENGVMNPRSLTVFEFYSRVRYFKEKKPKGSNH